MKYFIGDLRNTLYWLLKSLLLKGGRDVHELKFDLELPFHICLINLYFCYGDLTVAMLKGGRDVHGLLRQPGTLFHKYFIVKL